MNPNVLTAAISAAAAVITATVALLVNSRGFTLLDKRIDDQSKRIDGLRADTNRRLTTIEADLKDFFKVQAEPWRWRFSSFDAAFAQSDRGQHYGHRLRSGWGRGAWRLGRSKEYRNGCLDRDVPAADRPHRGAIRVLA